MKRNATYEAADYRSADAEIARFADDYLAVRGMTPRTIEAYQRDLEHFGAFLNARAGGEPDAEPKRIAPYPALATAVYADIVAYQSWLARSRRYAPRSMRRKIATLRTYYKSLRQSGRRPDNPAADTNLPKIGKRLPKALPESEIRRAMTIDVAGLTPEQRRRDRAILELLWSCGMRRAELVGLDLNDVDLDARMIRIVKGKGGKERLVPMTGDAAVALRAYLDVRPKATVPACFVGRGNRRISASTVYKMVRTYMTLAGIEEFASPHTWRHSIATAMRERGADLLFLRDFLGHESVASTEIYTKLAQNRLRAEYERFHPDGEDRE